MGLAIKGPSGLVGRESDKVRGNFLCEGIPMVSRAQRKGRSRKRSQRAGRSRRRSQVLRKQSRRRSQVSRKRVKRRNRSQRKEQRMRGGVVGVV